jgi:hypothetical protein
MVSTVATDTPDTKANDVSHPHQGDTTHKRELRMDSVVKFRCRPSMMSSEHPENNYRGFVNCLIILLVFQPTFSISNISVAVNSLTFRARNFIIAFITCFLISFLFSDLISQICGNLRIIIQNLHKYGLLVVSPKRKFHV